MDLRNLFVRGELDIMLIGAAIGSALGIFLGGWDANIVWLLAFMFVDFITGIGAACREGTSVSSGRMSKGFFKKVGMLVCVGLGYGIDQMSGAALFRGTFITAFGLNEALSILENIDRIGWGEYIPAFVRGKINQIRAEKGVDKL